MISFQQTIQCPSMPLSQGERNPENSALTWSKGSLWGQEACVSLGLWDCTTSPWLRWTQHQEKWGTGEQAALWQALLDFQNTPQSSIGSEAAPQRRH